MMKLMINPLDAQLDQPIAMAAADLEPGSIVRLTLRNHSLRAEARAEFVASAEGTVDVSLHAPVRGDYAGIDSTGLFWSARFDAGSGVVSMVEALSRLEPLAYTLTVTADDGTEIAADFTRRLVAANVVRTPVREGRLRGTLFTAQNAANAPGVVVLGGSDGGNLWQFVAALLAAHGCVTLSLAYFAYEDLPKELIEIPLEYFAEAVEWLRGRPEVGAARVGVLGMSRGGEAALLLGASFPQIAAVVALVPSGVTGNGIGADISAMARSAWTLNGVPFPVFPPPGDAVTMKEAGVAIATGAPFVGAPAFLRALESAGARIDEFAIRVERTRGAIFMMSGEDDQLWASTRLAEIAEKRLMGAAFQYPFEHRRYPSAGHFACLPPNLPATSTSGRHQVVPMSLAFGGTARGNAVASADLWPGIVRFLHRHLAAHNRRPDMATPHLYRVILPVSDIEVATKFYRHVFQDDGERVSPGRHYFNCNGVILACYSPSADGDDVGSGWSFHENQYIYFSVPDLTVIRDRIEEAGGRNLTDIETMPWGETMFYAVDPLGSRLSFARSDTLFMGAGRADGAGISEESKV